MRTRLVIALLTLPAALLAQGGTISPGMSRAQVVAALGEPATSRTASEYTYLFYRNDCGRSCGMNDLVVLRRDSVIDAIFRSTSRKYTGESSSPTPEPRELARGRGGRAHHASGDAAMPTATASWSTPPSTAAERRAAEASVAVTKDGARPTAARSAQPRTPSAEQLAQLRRELLGSGLTTTQIRARLRQQGYAENLLDADIRAAMAPAEKKKPSAPNDTHPSVPVGPLPVRPAPAAAVPPASTRAPAP